MFFHPLAFLFIVFCWHLLALVTAGQLLPGPQQYQLQPNGERHWVYSASAGQPATTHTVNMLNPKPTMSWNCDVMPALCENVLRRQPLPVIFQEYVVDIQPPINAQEKRSDVRRTNAGCTPTWITNHRCPESNQPDYWYHPLGQMLPSVLATHEGNAGIPAGNMVHLQGPSKNVFDSNGNLQYEQSGIIFSCDEFPPAS